jgi:hypothetical protein
LYESFLREQLVQGMALAAQSDLLDLHPLAGLPPRFVAEYRCKGLVRPANGDVRESEFFVVGIMLPGDYLRRAAAGEVLTWLEPLDIFHPNVLPPLICPGSLTPGMALVDLLYQCFEIICYQKATMNELNALNLEACQWARGHRSLFPIDRRPLKWKRPARKGPP